MSDTKDKKTSNTGDNLSGEFESSLDCLTVLNSPNGHSEIKAMNLKKQLRFYLDKTGMTASELARKSGVSKQNLSDWLGGRNPRNISQVKKVADCLNVTVDHLCFGEGESNSQTHDLDELVGEEWLSGLFEVKLRRVRRKGDK